MDFPLVTVIITCFNHELYITDCINSILNQSYENIEIFAFDDGSIDNSAKILDRLSKKYNFYFESQENKGVAATLNKGLQKANGKYLYLFASDDVAKPDAVQKLVTKAEKTTNTGMICGDAYYIDHYNKCISVDINNMPTHKNNILKFNTFFSYFFYKRPKLKEKEYFGSYKSFLISNYIPVGLLLLKKAVKDVGGWDTDTRFCMEDWEMWLRLSKIYTISYTNEVLSYYRIHSTNAHTIYRNRIRLSSLSILNREYNDIKKNKLVYVYRYRYNNLLLYLLKNNKFLLFFNYYRFRTFFPIYSIKILLYKYIFKIKIDSNYLDDYDDRKLFNF